MLARECVVQLRELDRKLEALRSRIASAGSTARAEARLADSRRQREELSLRLSALDRQIQQQERDSAALDQRIRTAERRYFGGQEPPFLLQGLEAEISRMKAEREKLDDALLQDLQTQEELQRQQPPCEARVAEHEADLNQARLDDEEQGRALARRLAEVLEHREAAAAKLDPSVRADYEQMLVRLGEPTAQIRRAACTGCRMGLSDIIFRKFRLQELVRCPDCGRFLVDFQS